MREERPQLNTGKMTLLWLLLEAGIAAGVYIVWARLCFISSGGGFLTSRGFTNLRYYTVLSNLAAGAASACCLISYFVRNKKARVSGQSESAEKAGTPVQSENDGEAPADSPIARWALRFRFVGAVMALTTFLTVALFFLPLYGFSKLYAGTNFMYHLAFPLLSVIGFFLLPGKDRLSFGETLLPILPVILYAAFYSANILINGKWTLQGSNDWYGFLNWGWGIGWCILAGIALATWLAGLLLRAVYHRIISKRY
ncbi:MAG: hypothetical protein J5865_03935 [Lachnospiraceae bacterium]|nr:hypothetical protein [Lachnospiraceae bacterium]